VVTFRLEFDEGRISVLIVGNTYQYRQKLDAHSVLGGYHETEGASDGPKTYYRVLKDLDCGSQRDRERITDDLLTGVFSGLALRVVIDGKEPDANTPAAEFLAALRDLPQLHFS
jgi:hypothetical protein